MVYALSNMVSNYTRNQGCGVMNWTQGVAGFYERTNKEPAIFWAVIWCFWVFLRTVVIQELGIWLFISMVIYQNPAFECLWWLRLSDSDNLDWYLMGIWHQFLIPTQPTLENTNWWCFVQGHMNIFMAHFVRVTVVMSSKNHLDNQGRRSFSCF